MTQPGDQGPGPTVTPTTGVDLGMAGLVGAVGSWLLVRTLERFAGEAPVLSWFGVAMLGVLAVGVAVFAWRVRRAHAPGQPRPEARTALAHLALGKAALLGGTALAAGYLVFAYLFVDHLDAPGPRDRVVRGLVAALLSVGVAAAGRWLERSCIGRWDDPSQRDDDESSH